MPNIDEKGSKIAAKVEKKSIVSLSIRRRRMAGSESTACAKCGYKIRSKNHASGGHHNGNTGKS